jgi:hypothetical protein
MGQVLAEISWNPEIRNILGLMVGIGVLVGSVFLLVGSNTGPRTGLLVTFACLCGWMMIMGLVWWMYGIGMKGEESHWKAVEINRGDLAQAQNDKARQLPELDEQQIVQKILADHPELKQKVNPENKPDKVTSISELVEADPTVLVQYSLTSDQLGGWRILVPSDKQRGDAQAVADATLVAQKLFGSSAEYKVVEVYDTGGKRQLPASTGDCKWYKPSTYGDCKDRLWDNIYSFLQFTHPEHFAIVQVQAVVPQQTTPGQAPPTPKVDQTKPVISVILIRSLGDKRFPAFMITLVFGILFTLTCWTLHRRDKLMDAHRAAVTV